jgi:CheY-like chemotaxis protein
VKLVALTGYGQQQDRQQSAAAGFDLHLVKPVAPIDVLRILAGTEPAAPRRAPSYLA